jgi:DNA-binding transcriptional ArsR family regulator
MSSSPFEDLANLDRLVHDPSRLAILTTLEACEEADFTFLQHVTKLTRGNLSSHLMKLEEAGLISVIKGYVNRRPNTSFRLTASGTDAIERHWKQLDTLRKRSKKWRRTGAGDP